MIDHYTFILPNGKLHDVLAYHWSFVLYDVIFYEALLLLFVLVIF